MENSLYVNKRIAGFCRKNEKWLWLGLMVLGGLLRVVLINRYPAGFNQDEASIAYDTWALLHHGIDRNGNSWPALLVAWGSGQNVLYAYLLMPFMALLGTSVFVVRLPAALIGTATLALWYALLRHTQGVPVAVLGLAVLATTPWHIMISRWGLESNILPFFLLLGVYCLVLALDKPWFYLGAGASFALCLYAYGTAFLVLPPFAVCALVYLYKKKALRPLPLVAAGALFLLLAAPIILTNCINLFGWQQTRLFGLTLPRLSEARQEATMNLNLAENLRALLRVFARQADEEVHNSLPTGMMWMPFGLTLAGVGAVHTLRGLRKHFAGDRGDGLVLALLGCGLVCSLFIDLNITRVNFLWLPFLYMLCIGLAVVLAVVPKLYYNKQKRINQLACCCVAGLLLAGTLGAFLAQYFGRDFHDTLAEEEYSGLGSAIQFAEQLRQESGAQSIFMTNRMNMPYIYALYYTQTPPQEFLDTVRYDESDQHFRKVQAFGQFQFGPDAGVGQPGVVYILNEDTYSANMEHRGKFGAFVVAVAAEELADAGEPPQEAEPVSGE